MLKGSIVAIITPMHADGSLDESSLRNLLRWHLAEGSNGVVVNGTTGESPTLTPAETGKIINIAVEECAGKIPVIAGTGTSATASTIEASKRAMQLGVDACLVVTPAYNRPTQAGLVAHYTAVAASCAVPIILYNNPSRTCCDLLPATITQLSNIANIIGVKEASGDLTRVQTLRATCKPGFLLFSGDDGTALEFILAGGDGNISAAANVIPQQMATLCQLLFNHYVAEANALNNFLRPLYKALFIETNPIAIKWAVKQLGLIEDGIRLPLTPLSAEYRELIQTTLTACEVISNAKKLEGTNL